MRHALAAAGAGTTAAVFLVRPDLVVRAIRALDRRLDLFAPRGAWLYARVAPRVLRDLHRAVAADAARCIGGRPGTLLLDVGAGPGDLVGELTRSLPGVRVVGVDPAPAMRAHALAAGHTVIGGSAEALPFADESVDLIVSTLSAHHWRSLGSAFSEFARVLRPGTEALIYDVRFAAPTGRELDEAALGSGLASVTRAIVPLGGRVRPFALIVARRDLAAADSDGALRVGLCPSLELSAKHASKEKQ